MLQVFPTTTEEFLAWSGNDRVKHYEVVDGEVRAMSPGSMVHGTIQAAFGSLIGQHLRASGSSHVAMIRPAIRPALCARANIRLPDICVASAPFDVEQIVVGDPVLLVEILSPSNKAETWTNVWAYTTIPSVREIVIVQSTRIEIKVLRASPERI